MPLHLCLFLSRIRNAFGSKGGWQFPIDERWDELILEDWIAFAQAWIEELRSCSDTADRNIGLSVVQMNFTARPEHQWQFILAAVDHASVAELGHIAAGPVEHLLGHHGEEYIERVEQRARIDPKFLQMLADVWKYMITDEVWSRLNALIIDSRSEINPQF